MFISKKRSIWKLYEMVHRNILCEFGCSVTEIFSGSDIFIRNHKNKLFGPKVV